MLDNKFGPEAKVNIKNLSLEAERMNLSEVVYQMTQEMSREAAPKFIEELDQRRLEKNWYAFAMTAASMKILDINFELHDSDQEGLVEFAEKEREGHEWLNFAQHVSNLKIMGVPFHISDEDRAAILNQLEAYRHHIFNSIGNAIDLIRYLRILGIEAPQVEPEKQALQESQHRPRPTFTPLLTGDFPTMRILGLPFVVRSEDVYQFQREMEARLSSPHPHIFNFRALAWATIATAKDIKIGGERGVEIMPDLKLDKETPPTPVQRNF